MNLDQCVQEAVDLGLIKPLDFDYSFLDWKFPDVSAIDLEAANSIAQGPRLEVSRPQCQWTDPGTDTFKQFYRDEGYDHQGPFENNTVYELARFHAGIDEVGIVKYCGTYIDLIDAETTFERIINPFYVQDIGATYQFLLRLDQGVVNTFPATPFVGNFQSVTGYGFPRLAFWSDQRFAWNWFGNEVYWIIPRRHALRLYLRILNGREFMNRILGRLMGYTQPAASLAAMQNVEHGWT